MTFFGTVQVPLLPLSATEVVARAEAMFLCGELAPVASRRLLAADEQTLGLVKTVREGLSKWWKANLEQVRSR